MEKQTKDKWKSYGCTVTNYPKKKYWENLDACSVIAKQREEQYGDVESNFKQILEVLNAISKKKWTLQDYCDVMLATKLARRKFNPGHLDNDKDLINYTAISLHLKQVTQ